MFDRFYKVESRDELDKVVKFEGSFFQDANMLIYYIGKRVIEPATYDEEGNEMTAAVWSDYDLFNVRFINDRSRLFEAFEETFPTSPIHRFS